MYEMDQVEEHIISNYESVVLRRPYWAGKRVKVVFASDDTRKTTAKEMWVNGRVVATDFKLKR